MNDVDRIFLVLLIGNWMEIWDYFMLFWFYC